MSAPEVPAVEILAKLRESELGAALVGQAYLAVLAGRYQQENAQLRAQLAEAQGAPTGTD